MRLGRALANPVAPPTKQLNVEIPTALFEQLKAHADTLGTSIRGIVTLALDQYASVLTATIENHDAMAAQGTSVPGPSVGVEAEAAGMYGARVARLEQDLRALRLDHDRLRDEHDAYIATTLVTRT